MFTIENDYVYAHIKPQGAELTSFMHKASKREMIWHGNPKYWGRHAPILFPFVGKLKNGKVVHHETTIEMGQHGFARDCEFEMLLQTKEEITFELKSNKETLARYPFDFTLHVNYKLVESSIITSYEVVNSGDQELLYCIGGHPAYNCPNEKLKLEDYQLRFQENETSEIEVLSKEGLLSNKQKSFLRNENLIVLNDDIFKNDALVFKSLKSQGLFIESDKDPIKLQITWNNFPHLGIWKPIGAPFICIEPWQGMADDVDASGVLKEKFGIVSLAVGNSKKHSYTATVLAN